MNEPSASGDTVNVAAHLKKMADDRPFKRAVVYPAGRDRAGRVAYSHFTFLQLDRESDRVAGGLTAAGIGRGTRTILMVKPGPEFFVLVFAMFKAGAVPVVVDPGMGLNRMLSCYRESRPQAFVGIPLAHMVRTLFFPYFRSVKTRVTVGRRLWWGGHSYRDIRQTADDVFAPASTRRDEMAAILFTTGSTGPAKGAVYTHGNFDAQVEAIRHRFGISPDDIDLPTFPLFALFDPALGMTAVIPDMDPTRPAQVDPRNIIEAVNDQGVTNMFASPALLQRVGRFGTRHQVKLPSLRRVISAGAPVTPSNMAQFANLLEGDAEIFSGYGATEAMPVAVVGSREIFNETRPLSEAGAGMCIGRPVGGLEVSVIRIDDGPIKAWSDDLPIEAGRVGEISVKGPVVTRSYYRRPEADALAKIADGSSVWHRMGDLGCCDDKGRLWYMGRKSHRVVTAAETLYSVCCEAIFNNHPRVARSALVGVGPARAQEPVICIEPVSRLDRRQREELTRQLLDLARAHRLTRAIGIVLYCPSFPVDIRHNSKIFREKLAVWAAKKLRQQRGA